MAHTSASQGLLGLARSFKRLNVADPLMQFAPSLRRQFAAHTQIPVTDAARVPETGTATSVSSSPPPQQRPILQNTSAATYTLDSPVLKTLYSWPDLEPRRYAWYEQQYLDAPMRRDILHRAVVFEADATRQGTASTKWRYDVHGSNRKLYKQKGTGRARVRDKKSPIRRGGGVAFGPKPRDFSTELQRKVYYQAFKIALSYRHRKGELTVLDNRIALPEDTGARFLNNVFEQNRWGKANGRSLLVTSTLEWQDPEIFEEMSEIGEQGLLKDIDDVDVKDLLETGRVVIERTALEALLGKHLQFMSGPEREADRRRIVQYL